MGGAAATIFDLMLCGIILAAALAALAAPTVFGAIAFFIVYGVFIAIAWLRLEAVDVAMAEAAIGTGLTGVLLLSASTRLPREPGASLPAHAFTRLAGIVAALGVGAAIAWAFATLPAAPGMQDVVAAHLIDAGAANPVTAVLLNYRAWDTLLESMVLLAALIGVWALAEDEAWGARPGLRQTVQPWGVLASFGRVLPPIGLMVGAYLVWAGTSRPGGAFQGGTVLAAVGLLVAMAGLMRAPRIGSPGLRMVLIAGPASFLTVGIVGALTETFLWLPPGQAGGLILGIEIFLTLSIAATLVLLVLGPPQQEEPP